MPSTSHLDLRGISWPMCLLKFKQTLLTLRVGEQLEVLVQDPEVADHILMIIDRSRDKVVDRQLEKEKLTLCIEKGEELEQEKNNSCISCPSEVS